MKNLKMFARLVPSLLGLTLLFAQPAPGQDKHFRQMCGNGEYVVGFTGQLVLQWAGSPHERHVLSQLQILCARHSLFWSLADPTPRGTPAGSLNGGRARSIRCTGDLRVANQIYVDYPFIVSSETAARFNIARVQEGQLDAGYFSGERTLLALALLDCKNLQPPHAAVNESRMPALGEAHGPIGATGCLCSPSAHKPTCERTTCGVVRQCSNPGEVAIGISGMAGTYVRNLHLICGPAPTQPRGSSTDASSLQQRPRSVPRR